MSDTLVFVSVVPSPYQRDVFRAIARHGRMRIRVWYLEHAADDSPWPRAKLEAWEHVLPGFTLGRRRVRSHLNWGLPQPGAGEFWIVNGAMTDVTTQRLIRRLGRGHPWCFWGEQPSAPATRLGRALRSWQYSPLREARAIVAVGSRAGDAYRALVPGVPVFNEPYRCELGPFREAARGRQLGAVPVLLFCGQMIRRKGIDVLLHAFTQLIREGIEARLLLAGREGELSALLAACPSEVRSRIEFRGFVAPVDLPVLFAAADVFVLPSRHDGWGVVVNQAIGSGLPIVCSDAVGAALDLLVPERSGLIVPAGNTPALAAALHRLVSDSALRTALSRETAAIASRLGPEHGAAFWEDLAATLAAST